MKKAQRFLSIGTSCILIVAVVTGCSTNMFNKAAGGAAAGAVSASFVGAMTDLILDGKVNTDRLARNMVSGAVGGATAGAVVGAQQDQAEAQRKAAAEAQAQAQRQESDKDMINKIGKDNYAALNDLLNYKHEEAFRRTLKSTKSRKQDYQEAGYAIQALIDKDRGNKEGMNDAIDAFLELDGKIDKRAAEKGLKQLSSALNDERRAQGIRKP